MKKIFLLFLLLLAAKSESSSHYSIENVISSIKPKQMNNVVSLDVQSPEYLYHWISISSLQRLVLNYKMDGPFPMKFVGTETYASILSTKAPGLVGVKGLFTWHNPVGGSIGGSNEIYGNHEAVLGLKLKKNIRIGLVVTSETIPTPSRSQLGSADVLKGYDLLLHVNGDFYDNRFWVGLSEWVILNEKIISEWTIDPNLTIQEMHKYFTSLNEPNLRSSVKPKIEQVAGPQHNGFVSHVIDSSFVRDLATRIDQSKSKLPKQFKKGWISRTYKCSEVLNESL